MSQQMTIFDVLYPDRINPLAEVARMSSPCWTKSRDSIIKCHERLDLKHFAAAVKHEYCPCGFGGHYGGGGEPNTLTEWEMRTNGIKTVHIDTEGKKQESVYSWEDFAREIRSMIEAGTYKGRG